MRLEGIGIFFWGFLCSLGVLDWIVVMGPLTEGWGCGSLDWR